MGIDKIKKKKKKTKKYKKRMPFWGGGESYGGDPSAGADDGGPGSGPSGGDDGGGESYTYTAPTPDPTPTVDFSDTNEPGVSPTPTVDFSDTNEPGVSPVATTAYNYEGPTYDEEVGINTPPSTPVDFSDTNEPGINPYPTTPVNFTDNSEPGVNPGLYNPVTYVNNSNNDRLGINNIKKFAPDPKGGFKKGITGLLKLLAYNLIPGLLPAKLGKMYQTYKTVKPAYDFAKKVAPDKFKTFDDKVKTAFKPGPGGTKPPSGTKPPTGFNNDDNNEGNTLVAKNVIAKSVQEYSPKELNTIQKYRDVLQGAVDEGEVLNKTGQQTLTQMNQVLKQYQV